MANLWPPVLGHGAELDTNQLITAAHLITTPFVWGQRSHIFRFPSTVVVHMHLRLREEGTLTNASGGAEAIQPSIVVDGSIVARGNWRPPNATKSQVTLSFHAVVQLTAGVHTFEGWVFIFSPGAGAQYTVLAASGQLATYWSLLALPQDGQTY